MRRAAIVTPLRTPVGRFLGSLQSMPAEELAATAIRALISRSGIDPARIEDVVMAQSYANSEAPCQRAEHAGGSALWRRSPGNRQCGDDGPDGRR